MSTKPVQFKCCDSGELMVIWPDGHVQFVGWIHGLALMWRALRKGLDVQVGD